MALMGLNIAFFETNWFFVVGTSMKYRDQQQLINFNLPEGLWASTVTIR
jgi:hypothetical protein